MSDLGHALAATLLAAFLAGLPAGPARAAGNAKIMLHALSPTTKNACERAENTPSSCAGYNVSELPLNPDAFFVYVLVVNGSQAEGIGGASFGIAYNEYMQSGVDVWAWTNCGNSELRSNGWPESDGGNTILFDTPGNCQTGGSSTLGVVASLDIASSARIVRRRAD